MNPDRMADAVTLLGFSRAINARLRETPGGTGLTFADLHVLAGIEKGYDLSSTLSRRLLLDAPRVSRIVDAFVDAGYITRAVDPADRRRSRLQLTPAGCAQLERGRKELADAMEALLAVLTEDERAGLEAALPGMRRALERQRGREAVES